MNHKQTENSQNIFNLKYNKKAQNHFKISYKMQRQLRIKSGQGKKYTVCSARNMIEFSIFFRNKVSMLKCIDLHNFYFSNIIFI